MYDFDEESGGGRELLGGKGVGLHEMTALGIPVPAGFTVTTDACRAYLAAGGEMPVGLDDEVAEHVTALERKTGKRFGDTADPLLVSVRSGAAISMPGMMDSILNLGLSDVAADGLAAATGNERFARDSYRRLIQMYGEVVDGVPGSRFEQALTDLKAQRGVQQDVDLTAEDLAALVETFKQIYEEETGDAFPQDAREQLRRARARSSSRGTRPGRRSTGEPTRSPTTSGRRSTSSRWSSGIAATHRAPASASPATPPPAGPPSTGSTSSTLRARTSLRGSAHPSRSPGFASACRPRTPS